jgi:hypothetical protein
MSRKAFTIRAIWDDEAGVYYSDSDIIGLHVEAKTLDEFEEVIFEFASELIVANHLSADDVAGKPLKDILPAIVWERPRQVA